MVGIIVVVAIIVVVIVIVWRFFSSKSDLEKVKEAKVYLTRGRTNYENNDYDRAIEEFTKAIRLYPKYSDAYMFSSFAYEGKGDDDRSLADLDQSIKKDEQPSSYQLRGEFYERKGNYDKAIEDYCKMISLWELDNYLDGESVDRDGKKVLEKATLYSIRGNAYIKKGDLERGIADFEEALRLVPDHLGAKNALEEARQKLLAKQK